MSAHRLGTHRVIAPPGALPQNAWKLDNTPHPQRNEILCDVEMLNLDSASFAQIRQACNTERDRIAEHVLATVRERGKQHNAVTGSGGMFVGRVAAIGEDLREKVGLREGDRIASLVSLTLTPLQLDAIDDVNVRTGQLSVRGKAILFESAGWSKLPDDIDPAIALAVLDVAGAPAQMERLVKEGMTVAVVGADGKSGLLCCARARTKLGPSGLLIAVGPDASTPGAQLLVDTGIADVFIEADARNALALLEAVSKHSSQLADVVINCVNVDGTEPGTILCAKDGGIVYFFSMNTSFSAAALGAEGMGKDVTMIIGNGYTKNHAEIALATLRENPAILAHFQKHYAQPQPERISR